MGCEFKLTVKPAGVTNLFVLVPLSTVNMSDSDEVIDITMEAARKAQELLDERGLEGHGIRVSVDYRGGDAYYTLEFYEEPGDDDVVVEEHEVPLYVDPDASAAIEGSTIDFVTENGRSGFTVKAPNQVEEREFDDSMEGRIREFLARNFPQIQGHGGEAVVEELDEDRGYVKLSLEGACSGCGISDATADAIRNNMPQHVDGVSEVDISAGDDDHVQIDPPF